MESAGLVSEMNSNGNERCWLLIMLNKFLLLALFLMPNLFYGECLSKYEAVNKLLTQKFSMTADFTQVFP